MTPEERDELKMLLDIARGFPYHGKLYMSDAQLQKFIKCLVVIRAHLPNLISEEVAAVVLGLNRDFGKDAANKFYDILYKNIASENQDSLSKIDGFEFFNMGNVRQFNSRVSDVINLTNEVT
jgi:hypothetical protein